MLTVMGVAHENEYLVDNGLFSVDIALLEGRAGQKVCLEVDGPYHFANNCQQPLGHTILRCTLLPEPHFSAGLSTAPPLPQPHFIAGLTTAPSLCMSCA